MRIRGWSRTLAAVCCAAGLVAGAAQAQSRAPQPPRGALLYDTHCVTCHDAQVHWRDRRQATDWGSLKAQVRAWQAADRLGWSEADVVEVARYLNGRYYRFAEREARAAPPAMPRSPS